jgi:hypothetical protein
MNQHQRKFLLETVEKQYNAESRALKERQPQAPSLNNYLVAAVLDGTFVMKSPESLRAAIGARVREMGKGDALIDGADRRSYMRASDDNSVSLPALLLFEEPPGYRSAREEYEKRLSEWRAEMDALEAAISAMRIKVQIGSDKALEALVNQADVLCSMSLTASNRLMLGNGG